MEDGISYHSDLIGLHQDDPKLIKAIKDRVLIPPPIPKKKLNLVVPLTSFRLKGQFGQSYAMEEIFQKNKLLKKRSKKKKTQQFYIEAGASCGEEISNSLFFEVKHDWTGLLVEPNPDFIEQLKAKNRNAWILPHCLSVTENVELVDFDAAKYNGGIIFDDKLPSDIGRKTPKTQKLPHERTLKVQCFPLQAVLQALDNPRIDYFSLDVEGSEYQILQTLNWSKVNITALTVELVHAGKIFPGSRDDVRHYLNEQGYKFITTVGHDDVFLDEKSILTSK